MQKTRWVKSCDHVHTGHAVNIVLSWIGKIQCIAHYTSVRRATLSTSKLSLVSPLGMFGQKFTSPFLGFLMLAAGVCWPLGLVFQRVDGNLGVSSSAEEKKNYIFSAPFTDQDHKLLHKLHKEVHKEYPQSLCGGQKPHLLLKNFTQHCKLSKSNL